MTNKRLLAVIISMLFAIGAAEAEAKGIKIKIKRPKIGGDLGKVLRHLDKEKNRGGKNLEEAVQVTGKTIERTAHGIGDAGEAAGKRLREGKIVDAVWHFQTDIVKSEYSNFTLAMQESSYLRGGAQLVATTFGGPLAGAAFTTWYVSTVTPDFGQALKAGAISGVSSYAFGQIGQQPVHGFSDAASKALQSAAVGGAAAAASGGNVRDGMLMAGASSGLSDAYRAYTGVDLSSKSGGEPVSKVSNLAECNGRADCFKVVTGDDMRRLVREQPGHNHIGKFNADVTKPMSLGDTLTREGGITSRTANALPYMNGMAIFHDLAAIELKMNEFWNVSTIPPAIVLTHMASGASRDAAMLKDAAEQAQQR